MNEGEGRKKRHAEIYIANKVLVILRVAYESSCKRLSSYPTYAAAVSATLNRGKAASLYLAFTRIIRCSRDMSPNPEIFNLRDGYTG